MGDQEEDNLDGSSIKPVSSLRSHFEQMSKSNPRKPVALPRSISPKPRAYESDTITGNTISASSTSQAGLRPPVSNGHSNYSPLLSPSRQNVVSAGHIISPSASPAVTVEPPSSPPSTRNLNLAATSPSPFLTADGPSSTAGTSSPRHFRIPSRPHTPLAEPHKPVGMPAAQPPEPPPPRRSTELRRDAAWKMAVAPPPVNRAEKPKIAGKQSFRGNGRELAPENAQLLVDKASPFSTPPSSDSSPGLDPLPPSLSRPGSAVLQPYAKSLTPVQVFGLSPSHQSLTNSRKDLEGIPQSRSIILPQATDNHWEQRPALPLRPSVDISTSSSTRTSLDISTNPTTSTAPIDTLRSSNSGALIPKSSEGELSLPALPKRNFSTPVSQLQPPPRSHGRSMTMDQASDRAPAEFRAVEKSVLFPTAQDDRAVTPKIGATCTAAVPNAVDYPDPSFSNRRPPHFKQRVTEVPTKFDARVFAVCGEYVCASGHHTRAWSLRDGEQIMSVPHSEAIKVLSLEFKPSTDPGNEGSRLWLGNNIGELIELEITSQNPVITTNHTAHNRREILKIHRHKNEMWTLDESGTLNIWASDRSGPPKLEIPSATQRVPKGHTYSMVVNDELWYATGNDLRIFVPTVDGRSQFQLLQRPLSQPGVGEITSGAIIASQPDRVYFGHSDGKVSVYSSERYTCLGIFNVSMYKINSLTGAGAYLWAAYNTGMIYIYDTRETPWTVKKDWRAHSNPVISLSADRSSFWKLGRSQVISLGADDTVKLWDGLLEDDWLETKLQSQDERYCRLEHIKALVMTWNAGASTPHSLRYAEHDKNFLPKLLRESDVPDILVFNFQELVDLEDKKTTAKSFFSKSKKKDSSEPEHMSHQYRDWRDYLIRCLDDSMPREELYHPLSSDNLVGLFTCIFVRAGLRDRIKSVTAAEVKRGMGGRAGNKGALIVRFMVDDTSLCFINCHLAAGQTHTKERNFDVSSILDSTVLPVEEHESVRLDSYIGGGDGTMILDHEICILSGDLNYRIDTMSRDAVISAINSRKTDKLLERDQLLASKRKRPGFRLRAFHEMPITFAPTYKYDIGSDNYDTSEKKRAPAWCDRILSRTRDVERLKQLNYRRHEVRVSDHRPVTGLFQITVKTVSHEKRALVWSECKQDFDEVKRKFGDSAKFDFLMNVCGLDSDSCRKLIAENRKTPQ